MYSFDLIFQKSSSSLFCEHSAQPMGSRPCESRNDLLNRWVRMQREERVEKSWEKPADPGAVGSLAVCERWRKRVCEELDQKLERLYNEPLPEAETRYLNDEVNAIVREIRRWEIRIVELGGIDYSRVGHQTAGGDYVSTSTGHYQYFGRARELPGVRELLEMEKRQRCDAAARKADRDGLLERVDMEYYGIDSDADLEVAESAIEEAAGAFRSDPILAPERVPTHDEVRAGLEKLLQGEVTKVIV
jgi:pre-mRNA-splicing factor ISY1